jgi:outer membrane protein TolC
MKCLSLIAASLLVPCLCHAAPFAQIATQGATAPEAVVAPVPLPSVSPEASLPANPLGGGVPVAGRRGLALGDALAISLSENPDLITIRGTANVGAAAVDVAGVYPWNPFVQAQFLPNGQPLHPGPPGGSSGQANYYIWAMQRFELAHQRGHRESIARAALSQVQWNIHQAELLNVAQTTRLYFSALYQQHLRDLAADAETLTSRLSEVTARRFQAGLATALQTTNVRIAVRQSRRQRELADSVYQAALLALKQQLGLSASDVIELDGDLTQYAWLPVADAACRVSSETITDRESLARMMVEARPDVLASRSAVAMSHANLNLARAARVQDIQAGPIYDTADDGTRFLGFRLQRDFGVFNNGSALARQRQTEVHQQHLTYDQLKRRAAIEAAAAIDRYERARELAEEAALETSQSPPVELEQAISQFEAGNAEVVDIVSVQNNLLQEARSQLDILNEVSQAAALVTQTTAIPPERLCTVRPPPFAEPTP